MWLGKRGWLSARHSRDAAAQPNAVVVSCPDAVIGISRDARAKVMLPFPRTSPAGDSYDTMQRRGHNSRYVGHQRRRFRHPAG